MNPVSQRWINAGIRTKCYIRRGYTWSRLVDINRAISRPCYWSNSPLPKWRVLGVALCEIMHERIVPRKFRQSDDSLLTRQADRAVSFITTFMITNQLRVHRSSHVFVFHTILFLNTSWMPELPRKMHRFALWSQTRVTSDSPWRYCFSTIACWTYCLRKQRSDNQISKWYTVAGGYQLQSLIRECFCWKSIAAISTTLTAFSRGSIRDSGS